MRRGCWKGSLAKVVSPAGIQGGLRVDESRKDSESWMGAGKQGQAPRRKLEAGRGAHSWGSEEGADKQDHCPH